MDINRQVKSVELLGRFVTLDLRGIASAPYRVQKQPTPALPASRPLPRSTPEEQGVASVALHRLLEAMDTGEQINPHSLMVLRRGHVILEAAWAPYTLNRVHMLYSMSKTFVATAVGLAWDEGILSLDEKLTDIFPDFLSSRSVRQITLRHLLIMSTGSRFNELGSVLCQDWRREYLNSGLKFEPGTAFEYNSMNTYMLAAALQRKTGMGLVDYLRPRLFEPLGMGGYTWETCPQGIETGGWGLNLYLEDAAKLGELYRRGGAWPGETGVRRILSQEWVAQATREQIPTRGGECRNGYGYQVWINERQGAYQFMGAFGQYVVVFPQEEIVIALYSGSTRLFAQGTLMKAFGALLDSAAPCPLPRDEAQVQALGSYAAQLQLNADDALDNTSSDPAVFDKIARQLDGREYMLEENICSVFPLVIQSVHSNYTSGVFFLRLERKRGKLSLVLYEKTDCNRIPLSSEGYEHCEVVLQGEEQPAAVRTQWRLDRDGAIVLRASISYVETPNTRIITLFFTKDQLRLVFGECPGVQPAASMFLELVGMARVETSIKGRLSELHQAQLSGRIRALTDPEAQGRRILHHGDRA